ncbi:MAG: hypothetical protein ACYCZO_15450 [Daejeonella sp.]
MPVKKELKSQGINYLEAATNDIDIAILINEEEQLLADSELTVFKFNLKTKKS